MIFVTVGTHEQPFNRLVKEIDCLKKDGIIYDDVFIQVGYSSYIPEYCDSAKLISYDDMIKKSNEARIIITHGGPGSIMLPLSMGKIPIVVPRQEQFKEHVDDHQVYFSKRLEKEKRIISIFKIEELKVKILNYSTLCSTVSNNKVTSNLDSFIGRLDEISTKLVRK